MADEEEVSAASTDRRRSPLTRHVPLWIGFVILVVVGVVTVLIPEITDEGDEEDGAVGAGTEPESAETAD